MQQNISKSILWNTVGSLIYFFSQWLITLLVVRLSGGFEDAGLLSLSMSITNVFYSVCLYSVRIFQVSDIKHEYTDAQYVAHRIVTCICSNVILILFLLLMNYDLYTMLVVEAYMIFKISEAIVDVIHGISQNNNHMDIVGKSFILRGIFCSATFCIIEAYTQKILLAIIAMAIVSFVIIILYDIYSVKKMTHRLLHFDLKPIMSIMRTCFPLLLFGLLLNLYASIPRIYAEYCFGEEMLGFYSSVSTPAVVIQCLASFVFNPLIPVLAEMLSKQDKTIWKLLFKVILMVIAFGALAILAALIAGDWALSLVFGNEILKYSNLLIPALILSISTALVWFTGTIMTIIRAKVALVAGMIVACMVSIVGSLLFISNTGVEAINYITFAAAIAALVLYSIIIVKRIHEILGEHVE